MSISEPIRRQGVGWRSLACAAFAAVLPADASLAQSFTGTGPVRAFTLPDPSAPVLPAVPAPLPPSAEPAPATAPAAVARLRFLPAHADGLTLAGETAERSWVVTLTADEAADPSAIFQVAYEAAASVSPETSTLGLTINDRVIGTASIRPPGTARVARFPIPPGSLVRGANLVRITASQHHRVDCSPEATFELWTRLRSRETGLLAGGRAAGGSPADGSDLADLPAVPPGPDGITPLNIRLGGQRLTEHGTERALAAAQTLALLGRYEHMVVTFDAPDGEPGSGIDLALGPLPALGTVVDLAALGTIEAPRVALLAASGARRAMLVITGRDDQEVDAALETLSEALQTARPAGSEAALRALADRGGRAVEGGERIALRELGVSETAFPGRSFRLAVDIRLPHDILAADYGRMVVDLAGGYAGGLEPGAQLRVEVNGGEAASLPLGNPAGERFQHQEILVPLSRLRPGRNTVAITAALPTRSDHACVDTTGPERTRFTLSDRTEIVVPPFARVARSPELSHLAVAGFPFGDPGRRPFLQVPTPDRDTMGAAATIVVRLAASAGHPIPFAFGSGRPTADGPVLVVAAAPSLDLGLLDRIGIDPQTLRAAWQDRAPDPAGTVRRGSGRGPEGACRTTGRRRGPVVATGRTPSGSIWSVLDRIAGALRWGTARADEATGSKGELSDTSLFVAQAAAGGEQAGPITVVSAASAVALRDGVACLTDVRVWERLSGRLALVDGGTGEVRSVATEHPAYLETQPRTVGNLRRIAAGWLSLNPEFYAALGLLVATCLAMSTHWLVGHVGRRSR